MIEQYAMPSNIYIALTACDRNKFGENCNEDCTCVSANTAQCVATDGTCNCKPEWTGDTCNEDVNECDAVPAVCTGTNRAKCVNTDGSHKCNCDDGYELNVDSDVCEGMERSFIILYLCFDEIINIEPG